MIKFLDALFGRSSPPKRVVLTPGRLFFLMSQELRQSRPKGRCMCSMPLPYAVESPEGEPNWDAQPGMMQCPQCSEAAGEILARHRALYDMHAIELGEKPPRAVRRIAHGNEMSEFAGVRVFG
jgi:hypothetical protein